MDKRTSLLLDLLKGIAMILVIRTHVARAFSYSIYDMFYIRPAVPIFIFVSGYVLSYRIKDSQNIFRDYFSKNNVLSLVNNIIIPTLCYSLICLAFKRPEIISFLKQGGVLGYGNYYIMLYLQLWLLVPVMMYLGAKSIFISIFVEIVFFNLGVPYWLYQLCVVRHLTLLYLGISAQKYGVFQYLYKKINIKYVLILLAWVIASGVILYLQVYKGLESFLLPKNKEWIWFSYATNGYWILCIFIISYLYKIFSEYKWSLLGIKFISLIGKNSFYIYLFHMHIIVFYGNVGKTNLLMSILIPLLLIEGRKYILSLKNSLE